MINTRRTIQKFIIGITALVLVAGYPLTAWADNAPSAPTQGPTSPTGADAGTYTFNSTSGMWENAYYIWNPATGQTTPKTTQTYSYNPATGHWDTTDWVYNAPLGKYIPNVVSVVTPPAGAFTEGGPTAPTNAALSTQGPNSPVTTGGTSTGTYDNFYNASISNAINQTASTGNATVSLNTTGGSATTGNATDMATILNLLQSATSLQGGNITTFSQDVGNWQGDLVIDPSQLSNLGTVTPNTGNNNLTINSKAAGQINNDVTLGAITGNAAVTQNTTAGSATSGDAAAIANIVNVINSVIGAGQSFIGTINIKGNLDGDILLPPNALNTLLAAGGTNINTTGPNSPINSSTNNNLTATLTDKTGINNTMNLSAASGSADVSNNTSAGNATTGNAGTNLTVLNLTGKQVVGKDALLVFVNVMGKWVGMIVNAPAGSTTAALGGGISTNGPNSPVNTSGDTNTNVNSTNNSGINNNVNLSSTSGNALVNSNTNAGNATSGNATSSLNLLNISTSSLSLSNWLGILFINVFGSWNGSFGIDTAAGNKPASDNTSDSSTTVAEAVKSVKVFSFVPAPGSTNNYSVAPLASANNPTYGASSDNQHSVVLAASTGNNTSGTPAPSHRTSYLWTAGSLFFLGSILATEEAIASRRESRAKFRKYLNSITVEPLKRY